jgi:hypothetical protein
MPSGKPCRDLAMDSRMAYLLPVAKNQHLIDAWRQDLKLKIVWALAAKLLGLVLLWFLFFRRHGS